MQRRILSLSRNLICILCAVTILSGHAFASDCVPVSRSVSREIYGTLIIMPRADIIVWKYKAFDGILHKRQYNKTKGVWIGDWVAA